MASLLQWFSVLGVQKKHQRRLGSVWIPSPPFPSSSDGIELGWDPGMGKVNPGTAQRKTILRRCASFHTGEMIAESKKDLLRV